jgi:hypothetical protein
MKGRYSKFFTEEIEEDIAVDEIEDHVVKWLENSDIPWDDMDEADQNSFVEETFLDAAEQYVAYCWQYFGHGDYQWEVDTNPKLRERITKWVYDILPHLSYVRVLNRLEERMIG